MQESTWHHWSQFGCPCYVIMYALFQVIFVYPFFSIVNSYLIFGGIVFNASLSVPAPGYPSKELTMLTVLDHLL